VVVADTLERANAAAAQVRVRYLRDEPVTSMESVLDQAYAPKKSATANARRFAPWRSRRGIRQRRAKIEATYVTRSSTTIRWSRMPRSRAGRLAAHGLGTATQAISGTQQTLAASVRAGAVRRPRDLPLCRRRLRCKGNTWPPTILRRWRRRWSDGR